MLCNRTVKPFLGHKTHSHADIVYRDLEACLLKLSCEQLGLVIYLLKLMAMLFSSILSNYFVS